MSKRSLRDLPPQALEGKRALVRVDFNVPLKNGKITDDTRLRASLPTISYLREKGARVVLLSHLGRPKGGPPPDPQYSLKQIVRALEQLLGAPVEFIPDPAAGVAATRRLRAAERVEWNVVLALEPALPVPVGFPVSGEIEDGPRHEGSGEAAPPTPWEP